MIITLITIVSLLESKCLRNKLYFYHFILLISNFIIYFILFILFIFIFIIILLQSCKYISKLVDRQSLFFFFPYFFIIQSCKYISKLVDSFNRQSLFFFFFFTFRINFTIKVARFNKEINDLYSNDRIKSLLSRVFALMKITL